MTVITNVASYCGEISSILSLCALCTFFISSSDRNTNCLTRALLFPLNLNINYLGYTESHYTGLVHLHYRFKNSPVGFNILAFPCNQFGNQEYVVVWFWCFPTLFVVPSLPPHIMLRPHISTQYCFLLSTGQRNVLRLNYLPSKRVWNL